MDQTTERGSPRVNERAQESDLRLAGWSRVPGSGLHWVDPQTGQERERTEAHALLLTRQREARRSRAQATGWSTW